MSFTVRRFDAAPEFRRRAEEWLLRREAEHNLLLGLLRTIEMSPALFRPQIYLAAVEREDELVGCAFRTPPFKLGLTSIPLEALPALADDVAEVYGSLPAVLGPAAEARRFAELWRERKGGEPRVGLRQRIFELDRVAPLDEPVSGRLRPADQGDLDRVRAWAEAFREETHVELPDPDAVARERVTAGAVFLWEDREPVSMAARVGETPHGARIGFVYTPPGLRGRGYASACVAELSRRTLTGGKRLCFLYTDLANPTSNRIYRRIGYRPVADVVDVLLADEGPGGAPASSAQ